MDLVFRHVAVQPQHRGRRGTAGIKLSREQSFLAGIARPRYQDIAVQVARHARGAAEALKEETRNWVVSSSLRVNLERRSERNGLDAEDHRRRAEDEQRQ
jgi:hypothetical protein